MKLMSFEQKIQHLDFQTLVKADKKEEQKQPSPTHKNGGDAASVSTLGFQSVTHNNNNNTRAAPFSKRQ
jgi:hypothetical protein